jgi:hypothetical protein
MKRPYLNLIGSIVLSSLAILSGCAATQPKPEDPVVEISPTEIVTEVLESKDHENASLVLLRQKEGAVMELMETYYRDLAQRFQTDASFYKVQFATDKPEAELDQMLGAILKVKILPMIVLVKGQHIVDRIAGLPPKAKARQRYSEDLELWFLQNALGLRNGEISAGYQYRFNNTHKLYIENK